MRTWTKGRAVAGAVAMCLSAAVPAAAQQWSWPERPENLQVLPQEWSGQRLRPVMTGFTRALGVRCSHCHVGEEGQPLSAYDFASDDNPNKERARTMLRMLGDIDEALKTLEPSGPERVNMWCHTCHRGRPRPMTLQEELAETYGTGGIESALSRYDELRNRFFGRGAYDFGENSLNAFGYGVMGAGDVDGALSIFLLNVELFPDSFNVYDSLAEAYMKSGDRELAIRYYRKSLELNPNNVNAAQQLEDLGAEPTDSG